MLEVCESGEELNYERKKKKKKKSKLNGTL